MAISDACMMPIRISGSKNLAVRQESWTAIHFLWSQGFEGYCGILDINPHELRRRLIEISKDRSGLTDGPFNPTKRRALRLNLEWFEINGKPNYEEGEPVDD